MSRWLSWTAAVSPRRAPLCRSRPVSPRLAPLCRCRPVAGAVPLPALPCYGRVAVPSPPCRCRLCLFCACAAMMSPGFYRSNTSPERPVCPHAHEM